MDSFEDARAAFMREEYALAARIFRPIAEQGNAKAQYYLGLIYSNGRGVTQDTQEALTWYRQAAKQGDGWAQGALGFMYEKGQGVPQDFIRAHMWYNVAGATLNDAVSTRVGRSQRSQVALQMTAAQIEQAQEMAWRCQETIFKECAAVAAADSTEDADAAVECDDEDVLEARRIRSLAEQGNKGAQLALGLRYNRGLGVLQDFVRAHMWLSVSAAAESGRNKESSREKRITLKYLDGLALQMTAAQIEKAQEMARRCQQSQFKECD